MQATSMHALAELDAQAPAPTPQASTPPPNPRGTFKGPTVSAGNTPKKAGSGFLKRSVRSVPETASTARAQSTTPTQSRRSNGESSLFVSRRLAPPESADASFERRVMGGSVELSRPRTSAAKLSSKSSGSSRLPRATTPAPAQKALEGDSHSALTARRLLAQYEMQVSCPRFVRCRIRVSKRVVHGQVPERSFCYAV